MLCWRALSLPRRGLISNDSPNANQNAGSCASGEMAVVRVLEYIPRSDSLQHHLGVTPLKKLTNACLVILLPALACLSGAEALAETYTTNFPLTENPISENGRWIGGKSVDLAWSDFQSTPGFAFGTQNGWS